MKTFASFTGSRDNNYNLLRFIAALMVIISHSFPLALGKGNLPPFTSWFGVDFGRIGVFIFFSASGYLIAMSYGSRHDLRAFCVARILRILPAILICTLLCALVLGPWISSLGVADYFKHALVYKYPINNSFLLLGGLKSETLPGVFTANAYPDFVNGSLWTLPIELRMYLLVAVIGVMGLLKRRWFTTALLLAGLLGIIIACQQGVLLAAPWVLAAFFISGILFYMHRDWIPANGLIVLALGLATALALRSLLFPILTGAFLVYFVFWFAYVPGGWLRKFNQWGDYSYGLYIYAFPLQQTLAAVYPGISPLRMFLAAFPLTLVAAVISWHWVEKPALALKDRFGKPSAKPKVPDLTDVTAGEPAMAGKVLNGRILENSGNLPALSRR